MLKKLFYGVAVLIIAVVAAININLNSKNYKFSDVFLTNVEALASEDNDHCPGCAPSGNGCYCKVWYPTCGEYEW